MRLRSAFVPTPQPRSGALEAIEYPSRTFPKITPYHIVTAQHELGRSTRDCGVIAFPTWRGHDPSGDGTDSVVSLKTATALGRNVLPSPRATPDEVIE